MRTVLWFFPPSPRPLSRSGSFVLLHCSCSSVLAVVWNDVDHELWLCRRTHSLSQDIDESSSAASSSSGAAGSGAGKEADGLKAAKEDVVLPWYCYDGPLESGRTFLRRFLILCPQFENCVVDHLCGKRLVHVGRMRDGLCWRSSR